MTKIMQKHFIYPVNMGVIKNASRYGKSKSGFCGDTVETSAVVNDNGTITALKYNVFGCYAVIATSSILSEWAIGKNLSDLSSLDYPDVLKMIGGEIEDGKESCVRTAMIAFKALAET